MSKSIHRLLTEHLKVETLSSLLSRAIYTLYIYETKDVKWFIVKIIDVNVIMYDL